MLFMHLTVNVTVMSMQGSTKLLRDISTPMTRGCANLLILGI